MRRSLFVIVGLFFFCLLFIGTSYAATSYTVQPGDTLYLISSSYGITTRQLMEANGLTDTMIMPGQVLSIPVAGSSGSRYTVQPGDTLFLIARAYGTTVDNLMASNNLQGTTIYPGQVLVIPSGSSTGAAGAGTPSRGEVTSGDAYLLAKLIYAEARGEIFEGQVGVGAVVLNRTRDGRFPKTISGVIYDPWQFEPVQNGEINQEPDATARRAAEAALSGADPTGGALYFFNPSKADGSFFYNLTYLCTIGNHAFYK